jgi:all-trans-retinol dehydrogenase (NAD+)
MDLDICIRKQDVKQTTNADDERLFRVNLLSQIVLIRAFLPAMLAQKKGHVVSEPP